MRRWSTEGIQNPKNAEKYSAAYPQAAKLAGILPHSLYTLPFFSIRWLSETRKVVNVSTIGTID